MFQSWSSFLRKRLRFGNVSTSFETTSIVSILPAECIGISQVEDGCDTSTDEHVSLKTPTDIFAEDFVVFQSFPSHRSGSLKKKPSQDWKRLLCTKHFVSGHRVGSFSGGI